MKEQKKSVARVDEQGSCTSRRAFRSYVGRRFSSRRLGKPLRIPSTCGSCSFDIVHDYSRRFLKRIMSVGKI